MPRRSCSILSVFALVCLLLPAVGFAQDEPADDEEDAAAKHFAQGRKLYGEGKYKESITQLLKAYELRPAPPILLNIGRTYEKLNNKQKALEFYRKFLLKARLVDPNRKLVEKLVKKLERAVGVSGGQGSTLDTPEARTTRTGRGKHATYKQLIHTPIDSARVDHKITVQAELPPQVSADKVWIHYRKGGEIKFRKLEMAKQGDGYVAIIPARYVTSTSLQYYLLAYKKGVGKKGVVAMAGSRSTPNIIVVEGGRAPVIGPRKMVEITSPYRTWFWVSAASAAAIIGGGVGMAFLAKDRSNAMDELAEKSCPGGKCVTPVIAFDNKARAFEKEGKMFNILSGVFLGAGVAAAAASGVLLYLDRQYVKRERRRLEARRSSTRVVRFTGAPWASANGGGFVGRIDF